MRRDRGGLPPLHLQLAGPAARPSGFPDHAFVLPALAVGEYPTPEDAGWLRAAQRFTAVVSLQDDEDLRRKGLHAGALGRAFDAAGLDWLRHPAEDGNPESLRGALDAAVASVHRHVASGGRVYLHCNAGLNRAPTVAIAYLHVHRGLDLDAARDRVKAVRACVPYMRVLEAHFGA
ncbi:MAG: dual specificity protein phosphatase family protein [Deltaproteobacteria bacterium]|nr:dual specificity protein phosphatase family protein [Deltaproteobacteria bacterium]